MVQSALSSQQFGHMSEVECWLHVVTVQFLADASLCYKSYLQTLRPLISHLTRLLLKKAFYAII